MAIDIILMILAIVCLLVGLAGSILPLPGPPLSYLGILLLHWTSYADFSARQLWTLGILTILVTLADLLVPIWGIKQFGGSRYGIWGSTIGLVIGLAAGPWGIFIGAFVGGLVGELVAGANTQTALRAAIGSFVGFLFGALLKIVLCIVMIWYAVFALI
jgi:uncharacterized protein YqgC (DUF456 family)